eukprot:GHVU01089149.1.p1 GENE.GHVU01089149.1~~GHVU01089149.1.p1  ORF type:complete len:159 (+),score=6.37 GHVU01089149.1:43-477(+)
MANRPPERIQGMRRTLTNPMIDDQGAGEGGTRTLNQFILPIPSRPRPIPKFGPEKPRFFSPNSSEPRSADAERPQNDGRRTVIFPRRAYVVTARSGRRVLRTRITFQVVERSRKSAKPFFHGSIYGSQRGMLQSSANDSRFKQH